MAEVTQAAYDDLQAFIEGNWTFLEMRDSTGAAILRIGGSDARLSWTHAAGADTLIRAIVLTGSDADVPLNVQFTESAIYDVATQGAAYSVERFSAFAFESADDSLTVNHYLQVPQVA